MPLTTITSPPLLQTRELTKSFGGVHALRGISLAVEPGELHALVGENGAGKSTFVNILAGQFPPDAGELWLDGAPIRLRNPHDALRRGITMIHQEPMGFPELTVAENIFLGIEPGAGPLGWLDRRRQERETVGLLARLGSGMAPHRLFKHLSIAEQQTVEIAKALAHRARLLIMDEPTSAMSEAEVRALFAVIRDLRHAGVTILYISHRLEELLQLADRVTVLRDGRHVATQPASTLDPPTLVSLMVGREPAAPPARSAPRHDAIALEVRNLARSASFAQVSFHVCCGEVVGLAGLVGAGRTELASALYGLAPADGGEIRVYGRAVRIATPAAALARGIAMVTEDRRKSGVVPRLPLQHNLTLASLRRFSTALWVRRREEREVAWNQMRKFTIKAEGPHQPVSQLSGGNQQKALLARALLTRPRILILDEPTRGIDVAAKLEIHGLICRLAAEGLAILLISSELPEILTLSDRVLVMREGRLAAELDGHRASAEDILQHARPR